MPNQPASISESLYPKTASAYWSIFLPLQAGAFIIAAPIAWAVASPFWDWAALYTLIGGLVLSPLCLIFAATHLGYLHRTLGTVHFDGESLSIFDRERDRTYSANLADCRWFIGSRAWATIPCRDNLFDIRTGNTILIVFPDSIRIPEYSTSKRGRRRRLVGTVPAIIDVGHTPETRFQWEQALGRLNVEKNVQRESLTPPFSQTFLNLWGLIALPVSFFGGLRTARAVKYLLMLWNVPADVAFGIAFPLFMPGVIHIFLFLDFFPFLWRPQQDVYRVERGRARQWRWIFQFCCVHAVFIIPCFWTINGVNGWTVRSAIAATIVCIASGLVVTVMGWQVFAAPRKDEGVDSVPRGEYD